MNNFIKRIKVHFWRIVILLIIVGSVAFLYWLGFKKHFEKNCIHQNADQVVMVDLKNIRNYFVFSSLKKPSQWLKNSENTNTNKLFDLKAFGVKTSDYLAFFHIENQPETVFYCMAAIQNEIDFEKAMNKYHFRKTVLKNGMTDYYSKDIRLLILKHSSQILCASIREKEKEIAVKIAEDLFLKSQFLDAEKIKNTIGTPNAITLWLKKNNFLDKNGIITIRLEDHEIVAEGQLKLKPKYRREIQFSQNKNPLFALGFDFGMIRNFKSVTQNKDKINKIIGFDLDSIISKNPTKMELILYRIIEKKDSSISYSYDDDFNAIEKVIVHTSREPSFYFSMQSDNTKKIFNYLNSQKAIDKDRVFVNFPFAKTNISVHKKNLVFQANSPNPLGQIKPINAIAFLQINFDKIKPTDWKFIIKRQANFKILKHFESLQMNLTPRNNLVNFTTVLKIKDSKSMSEVLKN
ncbi:hypothetical protein [Flavobacterium sp. N3904]|uniref:hypothetical protein n=1 Tax=Flavobacterium sp. N3904 TaxID=2986835 RepID=UPI00222499BD|nr:hypothetical protein [Flavobacterium sp. N3904]